MKDKVTGYTFEEQEGTDPSADPDDAKDSDGGRKKSTGLHSGTYGFRRSGGLY